MRGKETGFLKERF